MKKALFFALGLVLPPLLLASVQAPAVEEAPEASVLSADEAPPSELPDAWRIVEGRILPPRPEARTGDSRDELPPPEVSIEHLSGSLVRMHWDAVPGADGYQVYFSPGNGFFLPWFIVGGTELILDSSPGGGVRQMMLLKLESLE